MVAKTREVVFQLCGPITNIDLCAIRQEPKPTPYNTIDKVEVSFPIGRYNLISSYPARQYLCEAIEGNKRAFILKFAIKHPH